FAVCGPIEHVQVDGLVLARRAAKGEVLQRTVSSAINRIAVNLQPRAHAKQPLRKLRPNRAIRAGADVEQQVAALAGSVRQQLNQLFDRSKVLFILVVEPISLSDDLA